MSDVVISAEGIGKRYSLRHEVTPHYKSLREELSRGLNMLRSRFSGNRSAFAAAGTQEDFWALRNVSLDVKRGEVIGIIGANGSGKSTFLKILSRITEPTEGRARIKGRVASLLEVGTGFHPELTGRENILLNGVILGLTRADVRKKLDEIVAFAEIERFLDMPVKRYSSGMYVRLAFSIAAHLEPDILVIDEVLSVGDAQFQRRCLGRMSDMTEAEGRTVLFVSHNMVAVEGICDAVLWLSEGETAAYGVPDDTIRRYLAASIETVSESKGFRRHIGSEVRIEDVALYVEGAPANFVESGQPCEIRVNLRRLTTRAGPPISVSIMLFSQGQKIANLWTNSQPNYERIDRNEFAVSGTVICRIPKWPFRGLTIRVDVYTHIGPVTQDWIEEALAFESCDGDYFGSGVVPNPDQGILFLEHEWAFHADE